MDFNISKEFEAFQEALDAISKSDKGEEEKRIERNKLLINRYPFLAVHNYFTGKIEEGYDSTYLDDIPETWVRVFGLQLCEELREQLIKENYLDRYSLLQVKEKYGSLRWYDNGGSKEIYDIIRKYEDISENICIECGAPAEFVSTGWIYSYCPECARKYDYNYITLAHWRGEEN